MSCNIDHWKTIQLDGFSIPLEVIHSTSTLRVRLLEDNKVFVWGMAEECDIDGALDGDRVSVSGISFGGVGSGNAWDRLVGVLSASSGKMIADLIWEDGNHVRLVVIDGKVEETFP